MTMIRRKCDYHGCGSSRITHEELSIFRFPVNDYQRCITWFNNGLVDPKIRTLLETEDGKRRLRNRGICSLHFDDKFFNRTFSKHRRLTRNATIVAGVVPHVYNIPNMSESGAQGESTMKVLPISSTPSKAEEAQDEDTPFSPELPEACDKLSNDSKRVGTPPANPEDEEDPDELRLLYFSDDESAKDESVNEKSITAATEETKDGSSGSVEPSTVEDSTECAAPEAEEPPNTSTTEEPMLVDAEIDEDKLLADDDIPTDTPVMSKESASLSEDVEINGSKVSVNDVEMELATEKEEIDNSEVSANEIEMEQVTEKEKEEINKVSVNDIEMEPVSTKEDTEQPKSIDVTDASVEKVVERPKLNGINEAIQKALEERDIKLKQDVSEDHFDFLASDSDDESKKRKPVAKKIWDTKFCNNIVSNDNTSKLQKNKTSKTELESKVCDKTSLVEETEKSLSPKTEANSEEQSSPKATEETAFDEGSTFMDDSIDICSDNEENTSVANIIRNLEDDEDVSSKEKFLINSTENSQTEKLPSKKESKIELLDSETGHFSSIFKTENASKKKDETVCSSPTNESSKPNISDNEDSLVNDKSPQAEPDELSPTRKHQESETDSDALSEKKEKSSSSSIITIDSDVNLDEVNGIDGDGEASTELDTEHKKGIQSKKRSVEHSDTEKSAKKCKLEIASKDNSPSASQVDSSSPTTADAPKSPVNVKSHLDDEVKAGIETLDKKLRKLTIKELRKEIVKLSLEKITARSTIANLHQEIASVNEKFAEFKKKMPPAMKQVHDMNNVVNRLDQAYKKNPKPARPLKVTRSVGLQVTVNNTGPPVGPKVAASPVQQPRGIRTIPPVRPATANTARSSPSQPLAHSPTQAGKIRVSLPGQGLPGPGMRNFPPAASSAPISTIVTTAQAQTSVNQTRTTTSSIRVNNTIHNFTPMLSTQANSQNLVSASLNANADSDPTAPVRTQQINLIQQPGGKLSIIPPQGGGSNAPVAYLLQAPQSRPILVTPSSPSTGGRSINPMSIGTVRWLPNLPKTAGTPPNDLLNRQITNTTAGQVTVRPSNPGVPLQRGSLYTVGPSVASIHRAPTVARVHHPAPLPPIPPHPTARLGWKLPPPKPVLKISKVQNGIVLSWNMTLNSDHEDMKSYQIYAYQESKDPPSSLLWKTVGDVKALALPMACTLTQFKDGHKYHFSVRAVDIHSRMGPHSDPTSIVLVR